jgi:oxygen-independent coproporphyrinogen-3 oxidase
MSAGLYVHVPFCHTRCGYCDFYSLPLGDHRTAPLVDAIIAELRSRRESVGRIDTIFVGGGTPTVLPLADFERLFAAIGRIAATTPDGEFTTEANPATVSPEFVNAMTAAGVNRVSFGGQSLHADELQTLERLHDPKDIEPGIKMALAGGIDHVNLDLIFGIPGQSLQTWQESLSLAVSFGVDHISCYGLTYETGTPLTARMEQGLITPCDPELERDMYLFAVDYLAGQGFGQYEISSFARSGCECRHNLIYWLNGAYLGVGPSAASYVSGVRFKNVAHLETYVRNIVDDGDAGRDHESLSGPALAGETAMLQLRMNCGIDVAAFEKQVGINPMTLYAEPFAAFEKDGFVECSDSHVRLTRDGRLVADRVIRELLADSE